MTRPPSKLLESRQRVFSLRSKLTDAIGEVFAETNGSLTYGEIFSALADAMQSWANYCRKDELQE